MVNSQLPKKNYKSSSVNVDKRTEAVKRAMEAVEHDALMADERSRGATFRLNPSFVSSVAEWYSDDQANLLLAIDDAAKRNPKETPTPAPRQPFPKGRLIRHIRSLLEEAFWASLRTEEGRCHNFELEYEPQGESGYRDPIVFDTPKAFNSATLAKLAPALHSTQVIGVWPEESATGKRKLVIWGFAEKVWGSSLSLKTIEPGKIILSLGGFQKAGMDGQRADFVSEDALRLLRDVFSKPRRDEITEDADRVKVFRSRDLEIIARAMRAHRNGGTLLVVRDYDKSVVDEMRYAVTSDETLKTYLESRDSALRDGHLVGDPEGFQKLLESIGQLTAVDGATMVNYDLCILGFGAKIKPRNSDVPFKEPRFSGPFENIKPRGNNETWGTRHKSAAQFVSDTTDALAIVASQDGKLSVFMWDGQAVSVTEEAEFLLL